MKSTFPVILLAGGRGTRIMEETHSKPKPMVEVGGKPIIWHIMNTFANFGNTEFYVATGYLNEEIDSWVNETNKSNAWGFKGSVNPIFTGMETQTGGRIKKVIEYVKAERYFMTYGDGLSNVNLDKLLELHLRLGKVATVTSVRPPARFGRITSQHNIVKHFGEKNQSSEGWINGGFFILEKEIVNYIESDDEAFELNPMQRLVEIAQLATYEHDGFWQPMDTLREKVLLDTYSAELPPPWLRF